MKIVGIGVGNLLEKSRYFCHVDARVLDQVLRVQTNEKKDFLLCGNKALLFKSKTFCIFVSYLICRVELIICCFLEILHSTD